MNAFVYPENCRCAEAGYECSACASAIDRARYGRDPFEGDVLGDFDRDYHYPRDLAPKGL